MRRSLLPLLIVASLALSSPVVGQTGEVTMGAFITVEMADLPEFEEAVKEHYRWHAQQNDPWPWITYQALTGETEYVSLTPNHAWSDFDNSPVPLAQDVANWAETGAQFTTSETIALWESLPEFSSPPPEGELMPIVQVFEFEVKSGGEEAMMHGIKKYKEAVGDQGMFTWLRSVSADQPPTMSIAVFAPSFAALGAPGPTPQEILMQAFGVTEAQQIMDSFAEASTFVSSRIWTLRPDLSYMPN